LKPEQNSRLGLQEQNYTFVPIVLRMLRHFPAAPVESAPMASASCH